MQYLARLRLLGESSRARRMIALRRRCNEYAPVAKMLERTDKSIEAGNYQKYRGAYWTLLFLAEMHADPRDRRARRLAEHVLGTQYSTGGFGPFPSERWEIVCLTANCLRALVHFGFGSDPRVVRGYRRLAERILPCGGAPCFIIDDHTLLTTCKMTLPQTSRAVAVAPSGVPKGELRALQKLLMREILDMRVYRYVRPDAREFSKRLAPKRPQGTSFKEFKADYLAKNPVATEDLLPKKGWIQFGFPHSYNPDLLDALGALMELGARHSATLDEALDVVESKRDRRGRWKLDRSLNGKMLATVERKGAASKWVTLRALTILQHFGRWAA